MSAIIQLSEKDACSIAAIEKECFTSPWSYGSIHDTIANPHHFYLGVEEKGELAGFVGLLCVLDEGDIANVAVLPSCRGRGLGKQLMVQCLQEAQDRGITRIHLEVREQNLPAIGLYESLGFQRVYIRKAYYSNPVEDAIVMCKELPL